MSDGMTDNRSQPDGEASDLPIFARRLAMLRAARRQSLQEVADGASLPRSTAWQLEMGEMDNPGLKVLLALSRHFGVPVSYLTGEGEDEAATVDLSPDQKAELARLAAMRDDEIDTSDIPETRFAGAERGKFYRGGGAVADDAPEGACIFAASYEILAEFLRLPPGVRIVGIHDESWNGSVDIAIRGPGLPACEQGALLPRARAIVTTQCVPVATRFDPVEDEVGTLRAEVARLRKLVEDDGR